VCGKTQLAPCLFLDWLEKLQEIERNDYTNRERIFSKQPSANVVMLALFVQYLWAFEIKPAA
jgi:hypothetical protein